MKDARDLAVSTSSAKALEHFETALTQFHSYTGDPLATMQQALQADPEFALAHLFNAFAMYTASEQRYLPAVREAIAKAAALRPKMNSRERDLLDAAELRKRAPYIAGKMIGGALCAIEGKANPLVAAPAFAAAAVAHGARVLRGQRVNGIRRNGSQFEVITEAQVHRASRVVNAAGIDAGRVAAMMGATIHIQAFPIQLSVTEPAAALVRHLVYSARDRLTMKQTRGGTILIGGGWPAVLDRQGRPQVSAQSLSRNLAVALEVVPGIAPINIVRTWAAVVNGTENWLPLLGEIPGVPGFFLNYVPWMGFTGGPAGGRIIASLVQGKPAPVDFDLSLFQP